jgi:hypothetical protein
MVRIIDFRRFMNETLDRVAKEDKVSRLGMPNSYRRKIFIKEYFGTK